MRMHELYFSNLSKEKKVADGKILENINRVYGNYENWLKNFKAVGSMRGIGWVVLYYDKESGELFNAWINEHDAGHLTTCVPLVVIDSFEHAFMLDYGTKKADYIEAIVKQIDWDIVNERLNIKD